MIDLLKEKAAEIYVSKKIKNLGRSEQSFSTALKKSFVFLVIMPEDERDFHHCFNVLEFLDQSKKSIRILTRDYRVSLLPAKFRNRSIDIGISDLNKLNLPSNKLINKLTEMKFDAVVDLNIKDNLLFSFLVNLVDARLRIGFLKKGSDKFYNFQVYNKDINPDSSYNNFLNCLQMF